MPDEPDSENSHAQHIIYLLFKVFCLEKDGRYAKGVKIGIYSTSDIEESREWRSSIRLYRDVGEGAQLASSVCFRGGVAPKRFPHKRAPLTEWVLDMNLLKGLLSATPLHFELEVVGSLTRFFDDRASKRKSWQVYPYKQRLNAKNFRNKERRRLFSPIAHSADGTVLDGEEVLTPFQKQKKQRYARLTSFDSFAGCDWDEFTESSDASTEEEEKIVKKLPAKKKIVRKKKSRKQDCPKRKEDFSVEEVFTSARKDGSEEASTSKPTALVSPFSHS